MSFTLSKDYEAAAEGAYFTSWLGITASTAVATTTQALGTTSPVLVMFNDQPVGGKSLYMRRAQFLTTTAVTGITSVEHVGVLNSGSIHTTVGTLMSTPVNVNGDSGTGSLTKLYGGVNVCSTPAAASRIVHAGTLSNSIPIVLDVWDLMYGEDTSTALAMIGTMTLVKKITAALPPVIVPPRTYYTLGFWGASWQASAVSYRFNVSWIER